ncbi:MAG: TIGR04282 family arsenosugar biosynthesis glycosyltransferase [Candidatus Binataceae bacterium]
MTARPALIVFCREPVAGRTKTRLASHLGAANAAKLADAFIVDMLAKARAVRPSRLVIAASAEEGAVCSPYFRRLARRFDAEIVDQGGGSLGARMARALEPFAPGAGALLVGTDLPSLPTSVLERLSEMLRRKRFVLGPSLDGGYYAIGVRGAMPQVFTGIRWGSARVLDETLGRARRAGIAAALGPVWYDIDRWPDLLLLSAHLGRLESRLRVAKDHPCPATAAVLKRLGLLSPRR